MVVRSLLTLLGFKADDKQVKKYTDVLKSVVKVTAIVGGATIAMGAAFLKGAGEIEQVTIAFETMLGSQEKAAQLMKEITDFAAKTPFQLTDLQQSAKQLLAFGFGAEEIIPTMESLGNIAAGVGKDRLPSIVLALGKIRTKGRATMEELNIMLEAGVPILDSLAKKYGTTTQAVAEMVSKGQVGFEDVNEALLLMSSGSGQFAGLMEKQSKSFLGIVSNIQDWITNLVNDVGAELLPIAKDIAKGFLEWADANREIIKQNLVGFFSAVGEILGNVVKFVMELFDSMGGLGNVVQTVWNIFTGFLGVLNALKGVLIPIIAAIVAYNAYMAITEAITKAVAAAQKIWNLIMSLNPIGLIIAGIAALIAIIILVIQNWEWFRDLFIGIWSAIVDFFKPIVKFFQDAFGAINQFFEDAFMDMYNRAVVIAHLIMAAWSAITDFFQNLWAGVTGIFQGAADFITGIWQGVVDFFQGVADFFQGVGDTLGGVFDFFVQSSPAGTAMQLQQQIIGQQQAAQAKDNAIGGNNQSNTFNVDTNVSVSVPPGTPAQQQQFIQQTAKKQFGNQMNNNLSEAVTNIPG